MTLFSTFFTDIKILIGTFIRLRRPIVNTNTAAQKFQNSSYIKVNIMKFNMENRNHDAWPLLSHVTRVYNELGISREYRLKYEKMNVQRERSRVIVHDEAGMIPDWRKE